MSETTVEFSTDLEPEENEATLTEQEARKILLSKIARVDQPNASWVTNKIGQAVNFLHPDGTPGYDQQARTMGQYGEPGVQQTEDIFGKPNTPGGHPVNQAGEVNPSVNLAFKLAQILPPEMMKRSILEGGDIRALLQKVMMSPDSAERGDTFTINGVDFTANERAAAGLVLVEMTDQIEASYKAHVYANNQSDEIRNEAMANWEAEALYSYRDGVMHSDLPISQESYGTGQFQWGDIDPTTGERKLEPIGGTTAATEAATAGDYETGQGTGGGLNLYKFMNQEEVDNLFATTYDTNQAVQNIYRSEAEMEDRANGQQPDGVSEGRTFGSKVQVQYDDKDTKDVQMGLAPGIGTNTEMKKGTGRAAELLTLSQMSKKPQEMSRQQVVNLSKKMEQAGIYEIVGEKPMIPGDWTDSAFKKGFEALMGLAVQKNVSMTALLQGRTSTYQKSLEDAMSTRLTDPARIRMQVDDTAKSMLGRTLSPEEHVEFTEFVHELERRNAKVESGLDTSTSVGTIDDLDEGIIADIDARLSDKIREDNLTEFSGERVQDQYDAFSNFLAGPGRGGSF